MRDADADAVVRAGSTQLTAADTFRFRRPPSETLWLTHIQQKERNVALTERTKKNFTTKLPRTTLGTGLQKRKKENRPISIIRPAGCAS